MKKSVYINILFFGILVALCVTSGCKEDEELGNPPRLFRPVVREVSYGGTWIKVMWDKYKGVEAYQLQISTDSFTTILKEVTTDQTEYTFEDLEYDTQYQIRIKSIGGDITSAYYVLEDVKTADYPTKLITPTATDVIDVAVRVRWEPSDVIYTRIDVLKNDTLVKSVDLTEADNQACEKIIQGLQPQQTYVIKIYSDDDYCGKRLYQTTASENFGENTIDLRSLTEKESLNVITQDFVDSIHTVYPQGVTVVLMGGYTYEISTVLISHNIRFTTGLSLRGKALMAINGNFGISSAADKPTIRFDKIFFTEGTQTGKRKTDSNYGGTYVFNINQSGANANKIELNHCDIKYKRGVIRMQTASQIDSVTINNCVMDSIGGYGVVNNGHDAAYIRDIVVVNSTIAHADKVLVCGKALGVNSVTMQNVTTCYTPANSSSYFLDYNKNTVPGGITLKNCLFGAGQDTVNGVGGMRSSCQNIVVTGCYRTSDLIWYVPEGATEPASPINDVILLNMTSEELFKDPLHSDFTVTHESIVNKVGDPRWW
ncbi:fibronectin type III domain-containing protein [Anaerorudis cellulosivorans]|uniref:fibronectin type III domain-containing protein n=1 Tax=Anaerorudis cellulosivorans TaxID=3397862 RepID=UPI0022203DFB|nr:fibronectin type III domain-containing protein [Seramator thermalis]MCW1736094.1 fibronectin type III domain-containing protein [Seramator thermalis]